MEIILKEDVAHLGKALDVVKVKDGYARNFLFPRKLAILATPSARNMLEKNRAKLVARIAEERAAAQIVMAKIEQASVTVSVKVHDGDKLFGSVSAQDIAEQLKAQGLNVEKRQIEIEAIRQLGVFSASVKLMAGVEGKVKVWVVAEA